MKHLDWRFQKSRIIIIIIFFLFQKIDAQTLVFYDDFESGISNWTLTGNFGLTSTNYNSANNSLTESPSGNYTNMQSMTATSNNIDLSSYQGAELNYWANYNIENAFDYVYFEISKNGGTSFVTLAEFTGVSSTWQKYTYNIGSVAGYSNVKIRFRFYSDQYVVADGMFIDDVEILGTNSDNSPPLIVYDGPEFYQGTQSNFVVNAEISDVSGINSSKLHYLIDGSGPYTILGSNLGGNQYQFTIPEQPAGTNVSFKISAIDNAVPKNETDTSTATKYKYISGSYLAYDDGVVNEVATITGSGAAAVKITVPVNSYGRLVTVLIRNYRDVNLSNSDMLFHVWSDNNGVPGVDLITPFFVTPEATLDNPFPFTRVDLRDYSSQLSDLTGDFFVGYTVPTNSVHLIISNNSNGRSYTYDGTTWTSYSKDYEMRAIIYESSSPLPVELTTFTADYYQNNVLLEWQTATEVNNFGFEIERQNSELKVQNSEWKRIGFVEGHGNSNSLKYYSFEDNSINNSSNYLYRLKQIDIDGKYKYSEVIEINISAPENFKLEQNYPNPFNPSTTIKYYVPSSSVIHNNPQASLNGERNLKDSSPLGIRNDIMNVSVKIYDILGKEVKTLVDQKQKPGYYEVEWNARDATSGIYFYRLTAGRYMDIKKMTLVK